MRKGRTRFALLAALVGVAVSALPAEVSAQDSPVLDRIVDHRARRLDRIEFPLDVGEPHRSRLGLWCAVLKFGFQFTDERIALIGKTVDAILLVLAYKQDLEQAMGAAEISTQLQLHAHKTQSWHIQDCSAISGRGIYEGMDWVTHTLRNKRS